MKNIVCIISGPTASGKTRTSIELAKRFGGEIVNFDSLLFYKEITIGTAKPTAEEMDGVIHHMINTHSISAPLNAASYLKYALPIINSIHKRGKIAYLVGGSGFYLQALLYGMYDSITTPQEFIEKSNKLFEDHGISPFLEILKRCDPKSFERYHANDYYRIRRAVEHFWATGTKLSEARTNMAKKRKLGPIKEFNWNVYHIHLDLPKSEHFEIIQKRAKEMLEHGLVDEVTQLLDSNFTGEEKPLKSIGYKETLNYLEGKFKNEAEYLERIAISTRQLAKSQRTWFNKVEKTTYNPINDIEKIYNDFKEFLTK